jgi:hypothetical protein
MMARRRMVMRRSQRNIHDNTNAHPSTAERSKLTVTADHHTRLNIRPDVPITERQMGLLHVRGLSVYMSACMCIFVASFENA